MESRQAAREIKMNRPSEQGGSPIIRQLVALVATATILLNMLYTVANLTLFAMVKIVIVGGQIACYTAQTTYILAAANRTGIVYLVSVSAIQACIVGHIDGKVGNIVRHGVINNLFKRSDIVLGCRR